MSGRFENPGPDTMLTLLETKAEAAYLKQVSPVFQQHLAAPLQTELVRVQRDREEWRGLAELAGAQRDRLRRECDRLEATLADAHASLTLRMRAWAGRLPLVPRCARWLLRAGGVCWRGVKHLGTWSAVRNQESGVEIADS